MAARYSGTTLDTSGYVRRPGFAKPLGWSDLDPFEQGYIEALLGSCDFPVRNAAGPPMAPGVALPRWMRAAFSDLAPETLAAILKDCERFLAAAQNAGWASSADDALKHKKGAEVWLLRNGGWPGWSYAFQLTQSFPPQTATLDDDGKVRLGAQPQAKHREDPK